MSIMLDSNLQMKTYQFPKVEAINEKGDRK